METEFNISRLKLAQKRRQMTNIALAKAAKITPVHLSRLSQTNNSPKPDTIAALAEALRYPLGFFYGEDLDEVDKDAASFRSLKSMTAKERDASLAAASLAFMISDKVEKKFGLPAPDLLDLSHEDDPARAAMLMRLHWNRGTRPIKNMLDLLESKGIRVFSLSENTLRVDAFSCWRNGTPYILSLIHI